MPNLAELRAAAFEAAEPRRPLTPSQAARAVHWVRLMRARVPAFEALEAGDLVIVPGSAVGVVAPDAAALDDLAAGLANAGVAALLLLGNQLALNEVAEAAERLDLPVFRLDGVDPADLERAVAAALIEPAPLPEAPAARRLVAAVLQVNDGPRLAVTLLEPLRTGRSDIQRARFETLRALLEQGSAVEAAAVLGVHRNTVANRLAGIERDTGWDLSDPDLRLALMIALRIDASSRH